jgi:hypothetical protein
VEIPEITKYANGFPSHWLNITFLGNRPDDYRSLAIVTSFVRLVEGSLVHYHLARDHVFNLWNTHTSLALGSHNLSATYFEDCINSMHRAVLCMKRIRSYPEVPADLKSLFPAKPGFTEDAAANRLRNIRDAIQHMDDNVVKGRIPERTPFMLTATGIESPIPDEPNQTLKVIDRLIIGDKAVLFADLAKWLIEMGECADVISKYRRIKIA